MRSPAQPSDFLRKCIRRQRARGDNRGLIFVNPHNFFAPYLNQRLPRDGVGHASGECNTIDGEGMSGRNGAFPRNIQQQRSRAPHFLFQQPGRGILGIRLQGVRADQFGEIGSLMRRCRPHGAHLEEFDGNTSPSALPRRFRPRQTRTNDFDATAHGAVSASRRRSSSLRIAERQSSRNSAPSDSYHLTAARFQASTSQRKAWQPSR